MQSIKKKKEFESTFTSNLIQKETCLGYWVYSWKLEVSASTLAPTDNSLIKIGKIIKRFKKIFENFK